MSTIHDQKSGQGRRSPKPLEKRGISTKTDQVAKAIRGLRKDPARAARDLRRGLEQAAHSHDEAKYITAVAAYGWAWDLGDEEAWEKFKELEFWRGHSKLRHENRLRCCLIYIYGSHKDVAIVNRARDHSRAMQDYFDGLFYPDEVLAGLRKGGFSKAKQASNPVPKADDGWKRGRFQVRGELAQTFKHFVDGQTLVFRGTIEMHKGCHTITIDNAEPATERDAMPIRSNSQNRGPSRSYSRRTWSRADP